MRNRQRHSLFLGLFLLLTMPPWTGAAEQKAGRLVQPCPTGTLNCVSSRDRDDSNYIRPLSFDGSAQVAWLDLQQALREEAGTEIVEQSGFMLRAESRSLVFGFVDDLVFELDPKEGLIEVQSASRVGFWDFGVNRRRIENIRERFSTLMSRH